MYDLLIRGARILDGTGALAFSGDIGIVDGRIAALGAHLDEEARAIFEARGQAVSPGFIDAHTHDDLAVLRDGIVPAKIQQGATTLVIGNCGFSMAPTFPPYMEAIKNYSAAVLGEDELPWDWLHFGEFLSSLGAVPLGHRVRALLGHSALRVAVMGFETQAASTWAMARQEELAREAMQAGAAGLSLGLMYMPGIYTPTKELVRIARIVGEYGGVVTSHIRGEGDHLLASIQEMLDIAEQAEVAIHISHLKVTGRQNWGSIQRALDMIVDARAHGIPVTVDMYPYAAGSTTVMQLLPPWLQKGGTAQALDQLRDPAIQRRILADFANGLPGWENQVKATGWERIYLASLQHHPDLEGLNFQQAAEALGTTPEEALFQLLLAEEGKITIIIFSMDERDVDQVIQAPFAMIGSDGLPLPSGKPHPRLYGTFPRYIQRYVRELRSLSLEEAIHKITAFPAQRFGMEEHGTIAPGKVADLVIFDPERIGDQATYDSPRVYPSGIDAVIVAGQPVVLYGELQPARPGRLLASQNKEKK